MSSPPAPSWRVVHGADLQWRRWGDEYLVHHALSNDTHRLSGWAGDLLLSLAERGQADSAGLAEALGMAPADVDEAMAALQALDLVCLC